MLTVTSAILIELGEDGQVLERSILVWESVGPSLVGVVLGQGLKLICSQLVMEIELECVCLR